MSFCHDGVDAKLESAHVNIAVSANEPLIMIANALPWQAMDDLAINDLKKTVTGFWWTGRPLMLRIHLAAFILQSRFKMKDRETEERIHFNALFQVFCGRFIVSRWHCPDHTSIAKFRGRLRPETQRQILILVVQTAESLGLADPSWMDLDSTVQEANMAYPADASLMLKLVRTGGKVIAWLRRHTRGIVSPGFYMDVAAVAAKAKAYFFMARNTVIEKRRLAFKELHRLVKRQVLPVVGLLGRLDGARLRSLPWNIRASVELLVRDVKGYLRDVGYFIRTHSIRPGKILSLRLRAVGCIKKGKVGKAMEFGRVFQLGRIGGNFLIPLACTSVRMEDKHSVVAAIKEHGVIFGKGRLLSLGADKGYYSRANVRRAAGLGVGEVGLQCPGLQPKERKKRELAAAKGLRDRRAGIEPLIGHAKEFGLGRSRMKCAPQAHGRRAS